MNIQTLKDYGYKPHGVKMREDNIFLRHWLNIICAVVVTVATAKISFELSHISSYRYWVLLIFSVLVWCVGAYEITIKQGWNGGEFQRRLWMELILIWVVPVLIGYCSVNSHIF